MCSCVVAARALVSLASRRRCHTHEGISKRFPTVRKYYNHTSVVSAVSLGGNCPGASGACLRKRAATTSPEVPARECTRARKGSRLRVRDITWRRQSVRPETGTRERGRVLRPMLGAPRAGIRRRCLPPGCCAMRSCRRRWVGIAVSFRWRGWPGRYEVGHSGAHSSPGLTDHRYHCRGGMGGRSWACRQRRARLRLSCSSHQASHFAAMPRSRGGSATVASKTAPSAAAAGNVPPRVIGSRGHGTPTRRR